MCELGALPPSRDVYLLARRRDRKDAAMRVVADDTAGVFEQSRHLLLWTSAHQVLNGFAV